MLDALGQTVRSAGPLAYWIWLLGTMAAAGAGFWFGFRYLRKARLVEDTPTARLRSAPQGFVELDGAGYLMDGEPIVSPLSGQTCLWYSYRIQERSEDRSAGGGWRVIESGTSDALFLLRDGTGECVVDPDGADVIDAQNRTWVGKGGDRSARQGKPFGRGNYRYTERLLLPAAPLFAIGYLRTHDGAAAWDSAFEVREMLRGWKQDQPALVARFDSNADGRVDLDEWESARAAARAEVAALRREEAARPGLNVLSRPPDGRPFILASAPQRLLAHRYRLWAIGALCGFFLSTGATLYLIALRIH